MTEQSIFRVEHEYACYLGDYQWDFPSWQAFLKEWADVEIDYADYLVRWDWMHDEPDADDPGGDRLRLAMFRQRRGRVDSWDIAVTEADEPSIREWLKPRVAYIKKMMEPLL